MQNDEFTFPRADKQESGCKVGWYTYLDEGLAKKAAEVAKRLAKHRWEQGYDFGYQCPGEIRKTNLDGQPAWTVTVP
jgi:hypothetical protein